MAGQGICGVWRRLSLVSRIAIGLVLAVLVAWVTRQLGDDGHAGWAGNVHTVAQIFGDLFVGALKAVAPVLVFVLVMAAISQHRQGTSTNMRPVLVLYLLGRSLLHLWQ